MSTTTIDRLSDVIRNNDHGCAFAAGSLDDADIQRTAEDWDDYGMSPEQCGAWLDAGCFDAGSANSMDVAGLSPADVNVSCPRLPGYTWGYAYANSDVSIEDVVAACKAN